MIDVVIIAADITMFVLVVSPMINWTHDAIIRSLVRRDDVAASFRRTNDVIIASGVHWGRGTWGEYTQ